MIRKYTAIQARPIRVFFAIFPEESVQVQLSHQAELLTPICGGRKVKLQHIHLTLLFLGYVTVDQIKALQPIVSKISAKKFELILERISYWKQNKIVFIQAEEYPAELFFLANVLRNSVLQAGFSFERRPYIPHITLVRKAIYPVKINLNNPIRWQVNKWSLIESRQADSAMDYLSLDQWSLR